MLTNFIDFKVTGKALYPGLTYDNWMTVVYVILGLFISNLGFFIGRKITRKCKKHVI